MREIVLQLLLAVQFSVSPSPSLLIHLPHLAHTHTPDTHMWSECDQELLQWRNFCGSRATTTCRWDIDCVKLASCVERRGASSLPELSAMLRPAAAFITTLTLASPILLIPHSSALHPAPSTLSLVLSITHTLSNMLASCGLSKYTN